MRFQRLLQRSSPMATATLTLLLLTASVHTRLMTPAGPVHVLETGQPKWTVVYVHGYWTDLDTAWTEHRLAAQFEASGLNAVFIAPEAPSGPRQNVRWPRLELLLDEVAHARGAPLPARLLVVGHSGAVRTVASWVGAPQLTSVVLLDAFYAPTTTWTRWLSASPSHRLQVLARATEGRSAALCASGHPQVRCERSRWNHMGIVTSGEAVPQAIAQAATASPAALSE